MLNSDLEKSTRLIQFLPFHLGSNHIAALITSAGHSRDSSIKLKKFGPTVVSSLISKFLLEFSSLRLEPHFEFEPDLLNYMKLLVTHMIHILKEKDVWTRNF